MQIIDEKYIVIWQCFKLWSYNDHSIEQLFENKKINKTTIVNEIGCDYVIQSDLEYWNVIFRISKYLYYKEKSIFKI